MTARFLASALLALALLPTASQAQNPLTAEMQAAAQQFRSGDRAGALTALQGLAEAHPDNPRVFATLGLFRRQNSELEASLEAFRRAAALDPETTSNHFNHGVAAALLDRMDEAFEALHLAKEGGFNVLNVGASPAAARIAADPRYETLFPTRAEYDDPFVEGTRILHDWHGENPGDQFGWIARNIGDVDGDGVDDAVTSAPTNSDGAPSGGKIYVYSGRKGILLWSAVGGDANGQLGAGVDAAGDVNADGAPDVIAGAPYSNKAIVYSGRDGRILHTLVGDDSTGAFGASVHGVGDADGDGYGDLAVGEPFQKWGTPINGGTLDDPGRVHLISGQTGETIRTWTGLAPGDGFGAELTGADVGGITWTVIGAQAAGSNRTGAAYVYHGLCDEPALTLSGVESASGFAAMFMSIPGDVDGDGTRDIYISDWNDGALGPNTGRIYVFSGADGHTILEQGGENPGDGFGIGVSDAGDIDGDGRADLIVGAWQYAGAAASGGKLYAISGRYGHTMHTVTGKVIGETLGFDTTGLGDVDADGTPDFLVTSAWSGIRGFRSGRTLVISGRNPERVAR